MSAADRLSPQQRRCLQLVWERQATSKEIAAELGISKSTVDGYIAEAVQALGARDRRDAVLIAFGGPRAESGGDPARVEEPAVIAPPIPASMAAPAVPRPWRSRTQPRNALSLVQTIGWIAVIAIGSLAALALAISVGNGLTPLATPPIRAIHRLIH